MNWKTISPIACFLCAAAASLSSSGCGLDGGTESKASRTPDQACREWCANEPENFSCFQGSIAAVADCYRNCGATHQYEAERLCDEEWLAILNCEIDLDCYDLFGDCDPQRLVYRDCVQRGDARVWCETNCPDFDLAECVADSSECSALRFCESACPTQDQEECLAERVNLGTCSTADATSNCRQYCRTQDLGECVDEWLSTGQCDFDTTDSICRFVCPDVGLPFGYCVDYYDNYGRCPEGPPPPSACVEPTSMCENGSIAPIDPTCAISEPPAQPDACTGDESVVNPTSCTITGNVVTHQITTMKVHGDCNGGYNLDSCTGNSCLPGGLAPGEGIDGVDNALAGLAPVLFGVGGNVGGVDQAFHDGICTGDIVIELVVDTNMDENCATVQILSNGGTVGTVLLNRSDAGCVSGALGSLPLNVAGVTGAIDNSVVRMTVSAAGISDGILGGTADRATAGAIANQLIGGGSAVVGQVLDINSALEGDTSQGCNALSLTLDLGGVALP